jgi:hypothetical protein
VLGVHEDQTLTGITALAVSAQGDRLITGAGNGTIKVWTQVDGKDARAALNFLAHNERITSVAFVGDGSRFVTASWDGTVRLWNARNGSLVATLIAGDTGEWMVITPEGFFSGSVTASDVLSVVQGTNIYSMAQFYEQLYRPELVEEQLRGDVEGKYKDAASKLNLKAVIETGPAPQIEHLAERDDRVGDGIRISVRVTGRGGGFGTRIVWRVNGVTQGNTTPSALATDASPLATAVVTDTMKLVPGQVNVIEMTAYNRAGLVATPPFRITVDKFGTSTTDRPKMYVLAFGVDKYRMKDYQLNYAAHDASTFAKALSVVGSTLFSEVKVKTLTDEQVDEAGIKVAIEEIGRVAKPDDVLVLFLGGHGKSIAGRYYYYPQSLDFSAGQTVEQHGIGQEKWEAWLANVAVQKSLLIIDTCEGDAFRGARGSDSARQTAMDQLQRATGRNVIAASRDAAYEGYQGHGVLTYALLEALNKPEGSTGDDRVRVTALADHIGRRVPEISQKSFGIYQNPTRKLSGNDFPIGIRQLILTAALGAGPAIPKEPTHVVVRAELLREKPATDAPGSRTLPPGTQVRAVEFVGAWVIVARDGQKLGYVPVEALARMQ